MRLTELVGVMITDYRQMWGIYPKKVIIGLKAKRVWEIEIDKYLIEHGKPLMNCDTYMGVKIVFDNKEDFISLKGNL